MMTAGYLLHTLFRLAFLYSQFTLVNTQFNIYNIDAHLMNNQSSFECLYPRIEYALTTMVTNKPYCIHTDIAKILLNEEPICYGVRMSFSKMKSMNITVGQLFEWNAAIATISQYEQYLAKQSIPEKYQIYCKCLTHYEFGQYCQYQFEPSERHEADRDLNMLLLEKTTYLTTEATDEMKEDLLTCYVGISCRNSLPCLDWRQICNGVIDCDRAEDEPFDLCSQLELNQCNFETEFRCQNGMCIPLALSDDPDYDCLDRSDRPIPRSVESAPETTIWFLFDDLLDEELTCPWQEYSCGDNQCITYSDAGFINVDQKKSCFNRRNMLFLRQLLSTNDTNECWILMLCVTGFSRLYPARINCSTEQVSANIYQHCPKEFYFPPNPVIYSFVFFLYDIADQRDWQHYTGPTFICYVQQACTHTVLPYPTVFKNNLTCISVNQMVFSWKNFYPFVTHLFRSCFVTFDTFYPQINSLLYRCNLSNTSISVNRVRDNKNDCFFKEDEDPRIDLCTFNHTDHFRCLQKRSECIHKSLVRDNHADCSDGSDEYFIESHIFCQGQTCDRHFQGDVTPEHFYKFDQLCDNIVNYQFFGFQADETDETDCDHWPYQCYNSPYTVCDGIWNCPNGMDELICSPSFKHPRIKISFKCSRFDDYCIQFIDGWEDIRITCLNSERIDDGIIDCIGATDERFSSICKKSYPFDSYRRFLCMNSTICISPEQVCDTNIDCPLADDERVCPWLFKSNLTKFYCNDSLLNAVVRCRTHLPEHVRCALNEHLWFCDLVEKSFRDIAGVLLRINPYPIIGDPTRFMQSENNDSPTLYLRKRTRKSFGAFPSKILSCRYGYPVRSKIFPDEILCLCPLSYYGDSCQYQTERLQLLIQMAHLLYVSPLTVFRLVILLVNEHGVFISHDEIIYSLQLSVEKRFSVTLMYERKENRSLHERLKEMFVRIDCYSISEQNVQYISSWFFPVPFPFLPVNQMAVVLNLPGDSFRPLKCKKNCGHHGSCKHFLNSKRMEFCWCEQGWYGERCHLKYLSEICNRQSCAVNSQCMILNYERRLIKCICPLGKSGDECSIRQNACSHITCQNNGTCLPLDQRHLKFVCICEDDYTGDYCEYLQRYITVHIPSKTSLSKEIPAATVIFTRPSQKSALVQQRTLFSRLTLPATLKAYGAVYKGIVLLQLFYNYSSIDYYLIAFQHRPFLIVNTSTIASNRCGNISTVFNKTILKEYSYLKRLKLYHLPCSSDRALKCFFDEYRMCFCTTDHKSTCYMFNHVKHNCDYCKNDGRCVQTDARENQWEYVCICAPCSFGSLCQFSMKDYFINLDLLVGIEIKTGNESIREQPWIVIITLAVLALILIVGLISNVISFSILSNKKMQQVGCDVYLLHLTLVSQFGITALLARYIYMLLIQVYAFEDFLSMKVLCLVLEYSVRLVSPLFDWLIVCISVERAYMVIKNIHFTKSVATKSLKITRWVICFTYLINIITTLHRPFHLILIGEPMPYSDHLRHPWCILHFDTSLWNTYEKFINIFHLIAPLAINIISVSSFMIYKIKFHLRTTNISRRKNPWIVTKEQLSKYKPILISTIIVIICETPRSIFTFIYACIDHQWHRHMYLVVYLVSFLPLTAIVLIYILPSPKYRQYFLIILRKYDFCRFQKQRFTGRR